MNFFVISATAVFAPSPRMTWLQKFLIGLLFALTVNASNAAEDIQLLPLAPEDAARFLSGYGECGAQIRSMSGELIGVIRSRNLILVQMPNELSQIALVSPRYSKKSASYKAIGQIQFPRYSDIEGQLEIKTWPNLSKDKNIESFSAQLSLRGTYSSQQLSLPIIIKHKCGAKSRLFHGPHGGEIIRRLLAR